ncbi:unnamed protein product [Paramecium primaurelia]|uniref:Peptidase A1 domain-containing protein n=1 Tax=Paramecium primaurelia TaxID=5886 RepID=A0A8S1K3L8_PARPR|nr:unnamed protein product [Paramecium primaurelia]
MNLILICILFINISTKEFRIQIQKLQTERRSRNHLTYSNVDKNKLKATPDDSKQYLDDYTLTIPLTFGSEQVQQSIDTTSYITWVFSKNPDDKKCDKCPVDAKLFKCETSCSYQTSKDDDQNIPLTSENTYGGRVKVNGLYAIQDSIEFLGMTVKKVGFGLIDKYNTEYSTTSKDGTLGLAYGQDYIDYKKKKNAQVGEFHFDSALEPQHSILQQMHTQLINVPFATFAIKLEDSLQLLILGEKQGYFAKSKFEKFSNIGKKVWALKINKLYFGDESVFLTGGTAIFDSTTRFIWAEKTIIEKFEEELKKFHLDCAMSEDILKCSCNDEQYDKFNDINFTFNLDNIKYTLSKSDYIHRDDQKCYLLIRSLQVNNPLIQQSSDKPIIIIPYTFFKNNYVLFDQDENTISISPSYQVKADSIHLNNNTIITTSIVGFIFLILSLFLLTNIMQYASYDNTIQQQQQPQNYQQQQYQTPRIQQQQFKQSPYQYSPNQFNQMRVNPVANIPGQYRF